MERKRTYESIRKELATHSQSNLDAAASNIYNWEMVVDTDSLFGGSTEVLYEVEAIVRPINHRSFFRLTEDDMLRMLSIMERRQVSYWAEELVMRAELDILTHTPEQINTRARRRVAFLLR